MSLNGQFLWSMNRSFFYVWLSLGVVWQSIWRIMFKWNIFQKINQRVRIKLYLLLLIQKYLNSAPRFIKVFREKYLTCIILFHVSWHLPWTLVLTFTDRNNKFNFNVSLFLFYTKLWCHFPLLGGLVAKCLDAKTCIWPLASPPHPILQSRFDHFNNCQNQTLTLTQSNAGWG